MWRKGGNEGLPGKRKLEVMVLERGKLSLSKNALRSPRVLLWFVVTNLK